MFLTDDGLVVDPPPPAEDFMLTPTGGPMEGDPVSATARAVGGGVRDAAQGFIDLTGELGEVMNEVIPAGYLTWGDDGFHYTTQKPEGMEQIELPQVPAGDSVMEGVARGITQFVAGLALTRGGGTNIGAMTVRSAVSDALFDPEHGTMANWLRDLGVENELVEYLATDVDEDSDAYDRLGARLKQAFEGSLIGAPIDSLMWGFKYAKTNPDLRNQLMESIGEFVADESGEVPRRVGTTGQYVGAPRGVDTPQALGALRRKITNLADEGVEGKFWYERSSQQLLDAVGGNVDEADRLIQGIAVTSPGTPVKANFDYALQAYSQWKAGEPIHTGRFPTSMSEKLKSIFEGKEWDGRKTDDFYNNLMIHIDPSRAGPVTGDIWMQRAFGFAKANETPTAQQYEFITRETQRVATELGWEPHQVQAAIWVAMKGRSENPGVKKMTEAKSIKEGWMHYEVDPKTGKRKRVVTDEIKHIENWLSHSLSHNLTPQDIERAKFDYADALQGNLGQVSWESKPGDTTNHFPQIFDAPYEQQTEYHVAISKAFLDDNGNDIIAQRLGIISPGDFEAPGFFEGVVSPGTQTEVALPRKYKGAASGEIEPAAIELIEAYAAVRGILLKQKGVGWHRPFYNATKKNSNAVEVDIGRSFTEAETKQLGDIVAKLAGHDEFSPIASGEGVRFVNFDYVGLDNLKFQSMIRQALESMDFEDGVSVNAEHFHAYAGYAQNDWEVNKNGEGYMEGGWSRKPDLQRKVRDIVTEIQGRIDDIDYDFSDRYGWTRNDELNTSYRASDEPIGAQQQNINPQIAEGMTNGN